MCYYIEIYRKEYNILMRTEITKLLYSVLDDLTHHTEDDEWIVFTGELNSEDTLLERGGATDTIKGIGEVTISVFIREGGSKPHFHVYTKDKKFHSCVRLDKPEYFKRPGKTSVFSKSELKALVKILETTTYVGRGEEISIWENLARSWNLNSENKIKVEIPEIPDYASM